MKGFDPDKYRELTEINPDPILAQHMRDEMLLLRETFSPVARTYIDLGAGAGRIFSILTELRGETVAVEIDPLMLQSLRARAKSLSKIKIIEGDITELDNLLGKTTISNPILLLLQNTLGTLKGDWRTALSAMKKVVSKNKGQIILSLFKQEALSTWGLRLYAHNKMMNGEADLLKSNLEKGIFASKTGYISKWWTREDREFIKHFLGGEVVRELETPCYYLLHLRYL